MNVTWQECLIAMLFGVLGGALGSVLVLFDYHLIVYWRP